jgi:membrane-associated protease RseP (regulator of RpoE activity)
VHIVLFVVTLLGTTAAGAEWIYGKFLFTGPERLSLPEFLQGFYFSVPFLFILTIHEFGHYFIAKAHQVKTSLPYYLPMWLGFIGAPSIGTMGAFIRITGPIRSRQQFFDIGVAGPIAGFVVALGVLTYGFTHLPDQDYIFELHPEYAQYGEQYAEFVYEQNEVNFAIGDNLLMMFFKHYVADPAKVPNQYELYHYPFIFAGYLALFFTALNLLPIGQLDGGHVLYGLIGAKRSSMVSRVVFLGLVTVSGVGSVPLGPLNFDYLTNALFFFFFLFIIFHHFERDIKKRLLWVIWIFVLQLILTRYFPQAGDYGFYLFFCLLIGRFLGVDHPPAEDDRQLSKGRKIIGYIALVIFILCFTPRPFIIEGLDSF